MKFLKIALIVVGLLVAAFFAIGLICTECSYQVEMEIDAPVSSVWEKLNDMESMPTWMDGLESIELTGGQSGSVGAQYRLVFLQDGEEIEIQETFTEFDPPNAFAFDMSNEVLTGTKRISLTDNNGSTKLLATTSYVGTNLLWRSIMCLSQGSIQRMEQAQFEQLANLMSNE